MLKLNNTYILLMFALLLGACTKEETPETPEDEMLEEVRLGVAADVYINAEVKTRGTEFVQNTTIEEGQEFGIFLYDQYTWYGSVAFDVYKFYNNVHAVYSEEEGLLTGGTTLYYPYGLNLSQTERIKVGICAYSPYNASMSSNSIYGTGTVPVSVSTNQATAEGVKKSDLIVGFPTDEGYKKPVRKPEGEQINLVMEHAMAQVYLELNIEATENTYCESITVEATDFATRGNMTINTGDIVAEKDKQTILMAQYDGISASDEKKTITASVLIPPQEIKGDNPAHFTVTLNGCNYIDSHGNTQTKRVFTLTPYPRKFERGQCVQYTGIDLIDDDWIVGSRKQ